MISGEHEDHYDADFFIYNDVVVAAPDGPVEIYGYPLDAFPATDFHSATLVDGAILIIGNLGYHGERRAGYTQVLRLDLATLAMTRIETSGSNPGWIHDHSATLDDRHGIIVTGGKVDPGDGPSLVENIDDWRLDIDTWQWERLSARTWPRFEVYREDQASNHVWRLRNLLFSREHGLDDAEEKTRELTEILGGPPKPELIPDLYSPGVADDVLPQQEDQYNVFRVEVDGVVVRYVEDMRTIQVTVEGELPGRTVQALKDDLVGKLVLLEQAAVACRDIPAL